MEPKYQHLMYGINALTAIANELAELNSNIKELIKTIKGTAKL